MLDSFDFFVAIPNIFECQSTQGGWLSADALKKYGQ